MRQRVMTGLTLAAAAGAPTTAPGEIITSSTAPADALTSSGAPGTRESFHHALTPDPGGTHTIDFNGHTFNPWGHDAGADHHRDSDSALHTTPAPAGHFRGLRTHAHPYRGLPDAFEIDLGISAARTEPPRHDAARFSAPAPGQTTITFAGTDPLMDDDEPRGIDRVRFWHVVPAPGALAILIASLPLMCAARPRRPSD